MRQNDPPQGHDPFGRPPGPYAPAPSAPTGHPPSAYRPGYPPLPTAAPGYRPIPPPIGVGAPAPAMSAPRFGRRLAGWTIDLVLQLVLAKAVLWVTYAQILDTLHSVTGLTALTWQDLLSFDGDLSETTMAAGASIAAELQLTAAIGLGSILLASITYFTVSAAVAGRTVGMALTGTRIVPARTQPSRLPVGRALGWATARAITDIGLYTLAWLLPLFGAFLLGVLVWAVSVAVVLGNGLFALRPDGLTLVDRMTGVRLVPDVLMSELAGRAASAAGQAATTVSGAIPTDRLAQARQTGEEWSAQARRTSEQWSAQARQTGAERGRQAVDASRRVAEQGWRRGRELGSDLRQQIDRRRR